MSELVTGEAVPLELRLAKLPSRALAFLVDVLVLGVVGLLVVLLLAQVIPALDPAAAAALALTGMVALIVGVPTTVETLTRGKSIGKVALGLRVVRDDGGPVRFRHALIRALAGVFADFVITLGVGAVVCSLLNERGKRIGDVLAGTVVIRERIPSTTAPLPPLPPFLAAWAAGIEMSRLPDGLALAARTYLGRTPQLAPHVRERMGAELATQIAAVVSPPAPPGTSAYAYICAVLAERHRREALRLARRVASAPPAAPAPASPVGPPATPPATADQPAPTSNTGGFQPPV
ncbi:MAG TPA: RDD family protein [Jiangellaceae bacterium]